MAKEPIFLRMKINMMVTSRRVSVKEEAHIFGRMEIGYENNFIVSTLANGKMIRWTGTPK
jgi:hypothetical protein